MDAAEQEKLENQQELIEQVETARAIDEMVKTTGWKKCVIPRIDRLKEKAEKELMEATKFEQFVFAQQKIKAIDSVLSDLMFDIKEGEEAAETLAKEKQE